MSNRTLRTVEIIKEHLDTLLPQWERLAGYMLAESLEGDGDGNAGVQSHVVQVGGVSTAVMLYLNPETLAVSVEKGARVIAEIPADRVMASATAIENLQHSDTAAA